MYVKTAGIIVNFVVIAAEQLGVSLEQMTVAEVRRVRSGPGLWPGPRRQARWVARGSARKGGS
jgi:hypothetical protein